MLVLGVTQILAWGILFYPPVLMMPLIAAERGWSLDVHHTYDPEGKVVYRGDGGRQSGSVLGPVVSTVDASSSFTGATVAPDGTLYYADRKAHAVWHVLPSGVATPPYWRIPVAGGFGGSGGFSGDGGTAANATLDQPSDVALGPDGSVYIADFGNGRVRRVSPRGP